MYIPSIITPKITFTQNPFPLTFRSSYIFTKVCTLKPNGSLRIFEVVPVTKVNHFFYENTVTLIMILKKADHSYYLETIANIQKWKNKICLKYVQPLSDVKIWNFLNKTEINKQKKKL